MHLGKLKTDEQTHWHGVVAQASAKAHYSYSSSFDDALPPLSGRYGCGVGVVWADSKANCIIDDLMKALLK